MNHFDEEIESRLRAMGPARPPEKLMSRLAVSEPSILAKRQNIILHFSRRWLPLAAAACAAIAGLAVFFPSVKTPAPKKTAAVRTQIFTPVETKSELLSARDLGVFVDQRAGAYRLVETVWLRHEVARASDGSKLLTTQTRGEIIPVALKTY